ncbi:ParB/RepB/Spo0J family partition protein [Metapseudomonas otitidis]|uniref:ParB/RepB/Spo0J family partition protein n=1 Tax=Metapseudomonas otitidis TaxID=319939 RepID=UPI00244C0376|nr:ParB/RepB/Spo0J family partition protein [Pseudomonas otitidis]MDH0339726.1 ParB/RepB/Spo0J family partition protein [Pseudomonas otitidis]
MPNVFQKNADPKFLIGRQGREELSGSQIKRMAKDMKANGYDVSHPIDVANVEGEFIILDGRHRALAAVKAGIKDVPVNVHSVNKEQADQLMREVAESRVRY